jgi:hypothetical protein
MHLAKANSISFVLSLALLAILTATVAYGACTKYCAAGDTLSGSTCTSTVAALISCPSGFSVSGGQCVDTDARCSGIVSTQSANIGRCCFGDRMGPVLIYNVYYCDMSLGGPGGSLCSTPPGIGCYPSTRTPTTCPSGSSPRGNDCVSSLSYSCPTGYTGSGTTCTDTYEASTITTSGQCSRAIPATDGCKWCSAVSVCLADTATCPASCLVTSQSICSMATSTCQWCTVIGVCQEDSIMCFSTCLAATSDNSICDASSACQWCPSSTSIGVCQPNAGTCWPTCTPASDDPLGPVVCTASADCKWCAELGYCTERPRSCHTLCPTVGPDEPGICQVRSIQAECEWCGAPGSVEYCVARGDEARLRCAASCGGLIWRRDVCEGALECHWCGVRNAAEGGRCKPLRGKSRGYVAWRREVECDTGSETATESVATSRSLSRSPTRTFVLSNSISASRSRVRSPTASTTESAPASRSHTGTSSATNTLSISHSCAFTVPTLTLIVTSSLTGTTTATPTERSKSIAWSGTPTLTLSTTNTSSPTATLDLTATRYYSRDRSVVEAVAVHIAVGLSIAAAASGGTMSSSMGRVIAARNVGQCWGPAGSSVFSLPIDVCGGTDSVDDVQLEAQGDATVSAAIVFVGALGLVLCCALHCQMDRSSWRSSMSELSVLSALTPLWVAALPILVGGAVTAAAAPMSQEHPLASFCAGAAALVAASLTTIS